MLSVLKKYFFAVRSHKTQTAFFASHTQGRRPSHQLETFSHEGVTNISEETMSLTQSVRYPCDKPSSTKQRPPIAPFTLTPVVPLAESGLQAATASEGRRQLQQQPPVEQKGQTQNGKTLTADTPSIPKCGCVIL